MMGSLWAKKVLSLWLVLIAVTIVQGCGDDDTTLRAPTPTRTPDIGALPPAIIIGSTLPADIDGGASQADLKTASEFAWQEFIALNWPALSGRRDTPDTGAAFGDTRLTGPLVWQTFRHKVEIYPGSGSPPGFNASAADFGYSIVPPQYVYKAGVVDPCTGQTPPAQPAWVNLDEISQIGLDSMLAGVVGAAAGTNSAPQLIRFLAKANKEHYVYVVNPTNDFWLHSSKYDTAVANFKAVATGNGTPAKLPGPVINFPPGMVEVKAAFRQLTDAEAASKRFYQTTVRFYEQDDADPNQACYREAVWGMVALHIIHKTPTAPYFVFATFEQADNLLTPAGLSVEDVNGAIINPPAPGSTTTTPALTYTDGTPPMLGIVGSQFCTATGDRIFYTESAPPFDSPPAGGNICVNRRDRDIPLIVQGVNQVAHNAIAQYDTAKGLVSSPWSFYKLVNVQWVPFDLSAINPADPNRAAATFYQNNIVVETDFTLQNFSGQIASNGAPTNLPANFDRFTPGRTTFQNVLQFDATGTLTKTSNMGGCMGCHGNGQLSGNDFSFILAGGRNIYGPEAPQVTDPGATNPFPHQ